MRRHRTRRLRSTLPIVLLALGGCATGGPSADPGDPFRQDPAASGEIEIRVVNLNFSDATVWALIRDSRRERLGVVSGKRTETFRMRWPIPDLLRIEFDLLAGQRCLTGSLQVDPGDLLELQISSAPESTPGCR